MKINKYHLDFVLNAFNATENEIGKSLIDFGQELKILRDENSAGAANFNISIIADDPTVIFDLCAQFGRITSVKINEV